MKAVVFNVYLAGGVCANKGGIMRIIKCVVDGMLPEYADTGSSGMDLKAWKYCKIRELDKALNFPEEGVCLYSGDRILIKTGLCIQLPKGYEAQVRPRSGLALKHGISVVNTPGTIDESYRGDIGVILINHGKYPFLIKEGDRIAQLVFQKVEKFQLKISEELSDTGRGTGGYGSTGI